MNSDPRAGMPKWQSIHTIIFDFDGIFTDNKVYTNQLGEEFVRCDRGDGLGINILGRFAELHNWDLNMFILSKEKNNVVKQRAKKIGLKCFSGIDDKYQHVNEYLKSVKPGKSNSEPINSGLVYLGNDLNDLHVMSLAGTSICPSDSHPLILESSDIVIERKGGDGFVRHFIELLLRMSEMSKGEVISLLSK